MGRLILVLLIAAGIAFLMPAPVVHHEASVEINADREKVWDALSDIKGWPRWIEEVDSVSFQSPQHDGEGTELRLDGKFYTTFERAVRWEPYNRIDFAVSFKPNLTTDHVLRYMMTPQFDRVQVSVQEEYRMRGGYLGHAFDLMMFDRMREGFRGPALGYLKRLAETGVGMGQ
jgi:uncharacterized membrane protein